MEASTEAPGVFSSLAGQIYCLLKTCSTLGNHIRTCPYYRLGLKIRACVIFIPASLVPRSVYLVVHTQSKLADAPNNKKRDTLYKTPQCREDVFHLKTLCEEIMEGNKVESVKIICQRSWQMDQISQPISGRQFLIASDFMKRKIQCQPISSLSSSSSKHLISFRKFVFWGWERLLGDLVISKLHKGL